MDELEDRLQKLGIDVLYKFKGQTQEKQGISFRMENISFKGSQIDRKYSLAGLEKILDLQQKLFRTKQDPPALNSERILKKSRQMQNPFQPAKLASTYEALSNEAAETAMSRAAQILFQTTFAGAGTGGAGELTPEEKRKRKKKKRPNF
jgi:hypothetical protein